jgi:hypothetical protein
MAHDSRLRERPPQEFIEVAFYAAARNARLEVMRILRHEGISVQGISNALCEAAAASQLEAVQELFRMATLERVRSDCRLLHEPEGLLARNGGVDAALDTKTSAADGSLYAHGFSAEGFVEVIETEAAWDVLDSVGGAPARGSATGAVPR